jgi:hypothetical protein
MPGYRIVATGIKEFDYPKGNDNVYTSYTEKAESRWTVLEEASCSPGPKLTSTFY